MSQRIVRSTEPAEGGYWVTIEITQAYTDGTSRFDRVWVSREDLRGKTLAQRRHAIIDALDDSPLAGIAGETVSAPTATRDILEDRMVAQYETWRRWKLTREEAQARGLPALVVTALTTRENDAWTAYGNALLVWRSAPA